jgi:hypothetical protein
MNKFRTFIRLFGTVLATVVLTAVVLVNPAYAGNQLICSPMIQNIDTNVNFPKGAFSLAGDYGEARIRSFYNVNTGDSVLYKGYTTNFAGGGDFAAHKLCYIYQAKSVGAPSTLIMAFGRGSDCNNWYSWAQVQSAVEYSGCDVSGNTVTLK